MGRFGISLAVLWASIVSFGIAEVEQPYHLDQELEDEIGADDNKQALQRTRQRIAKGLTATYGVVMVSNPQHEASYSAHTIPIWKAYCEKHGYDFFLQEEPLSYTKWDHWTKPRVLIELTSKAKWKYIWLVDATSLPVDFEKGWPYAIKTHMRQQRYSNDNQKDRLIWAPEDCEDEYEDKVAQGSCYGPMLSGSIFWSKPKLLVPILKQWYLKHKTMDNEQRGLKEALQKTREGHNYDTIFWSDVQKEFGRPTSNFLASHNFDVALKYNVRDQVIKTIKKHYGAGNKILGNVLNENGQHKPEL